MKRHEYKGFSLEFDDGPHAERIWKLYHVVTGSYAGDADTLRAAKERVDGIHADPYEYAAYAGCEVKELIPVRGKTRGSISRWKYGLSSAPKGASDDSKGGGR